jgi:hypothetical protein
VPVVGCGALLTLLPAWRFAGCLGFLTPRSGFSFFLGCQRRFGVFKLFDRLFLGFQTLIAPALAFGWSSPATLAVAIRFRIWLKFAVAADKGRVPDLLLQLVGQLSHKFW